MAEVIQRPLSDGPLAIDLANTVWNKDGQPFDWLLTQGALEQFCNDHGTTFESQDADIVRQALAKSRALIHRLFDVIADQDTEDPAVLSIDIDKALADTRVRIHFEGNALQVQNTETRPGFTLATDALLNGLELAQHSPDRLRCCADDACILWFFDSSRGGRRRWCSMETCGNRTKAQRHYEKSRSSTGQ